MIDHVRRLPQTHSLRAAIEDAARRRVHVTGLKGSSPVLVAEALRQSAHALRGAMAAIGAAAGQQVATTLEEMGRSSQLDGVREVYATLVTHVEALNAAVEAAGLVSTPVARSASRSKRTRKASPKSRRRS